MSIWLNHKKILKENLKRTKPCYKLGYCPYGCLIEEFPLRNKQNKKISCEIFGHDCPMFYHGEDFSEFGKRKIKESLKEK